LEEKRVVRDGSQAYMKKIGIAFKKYFIISGILINLFFFWMLSGLPIFIDRPLIKSDDPLQGDAIICLGAGLTSDNFPPNEGWTRIYTAVQLFLDKYAPKIFFSGAGGRNISEAEIYAEVAEWLGCPKEAISLEIEANRTADHPLNMLKKIENHINQDSPINIVTSPLHSRRAYLCFKKSGFRNFRLVTSYSSRQDNPLFVRALRKSQFDSYRPAKKDHYALFFKIEQRTEFFFDTLREWAALGWYKIKGYI